MCFSMLLTEGPSVLHFEDIKLYWSYLFKVCSGRFKIFNNDKTNRIKYYVNI